MHNKHICLIMQLSAACWQELRDSGGPASLRPSQSLCPSHKSLKILQKVINFIEMNEHCVLLLHVT